MSAAQADRGDYFIHDAGGAAQSFDYQCSRRRRIAAGSGTTVQEVNQLLREFEQMRKLMKSMGKLQNQGRDPRQAHPLFRRK